MFDLTLLVFLFQFLTPEGPQKFTLQQILKRISRCHSGEFARRNKPLIYVEDTDDKVVEERRHDELDLRGLDIELRTEAAEILSDREHAIWVSVEQAVFLLNLHLYLIIEAYLIVYIFITFIPYHFISYPCLL